jgi:hypothetical protein
VRGMFQICQLARVSSDEQMAVFETWKAMSMYMFL